MTSRLRLNRLLVTRGSSALYDETFHDGVNIIHGSNGGGKSTIADFIFFGLGGDLTEWKPSASRAENTLIEITTPSGKMTLRRAVSTKKTRPMEIYFGEMQQALESGSGNWQELPYMRPEHGYSFSQVLFKAMGLPEAISDGSSNITMHQILRLLYVDQLTPVQRIFRVESFDKWQTRQAVGDLLAGVGGYDLFEKQMKLREVRKKYDSAVTLYRNLVSVASGYGEKILTEHIETAMKASQEERSNLLAVIENLLTNSEIEEEPPEIAKNRKEATRAYNSARRQVRDLEDDVETLGYEIDDADGFIEHLEQSLRDFEVASETFSALGHLDFEYCPSCFAPVQTKEVGHCQLCDTPRSKEEDSSRTLAVKLDLQMQLKESLSLQAERVSELKEKKSTLKVAKRALRKTAATLEFSRSSSSFGREAEVAELSRKIGFIDSELESLQKRLEIAEKIKSASDAKEDLNNQLTRLNNEITSIERKQGARKAKAYSTISTEAKKLLDEDLQEYSDFGKVEHVEFDFSEDWMAINGEKNRAGSASGMIVLKNSFAAAMFRSSLVDKKFKLPRWMLFDNIEDKGMVEERSWNFQRLLIKLSQESKEPHQLIYTTSKIAPELENSKLVVGRKYTRDSRSLRN
ncbi:ATP-binding protein [Leisingera aquimarina]|uniref:ATP-binding protein n=1 Tax=Leisingera aquimarina TaxID=476529 RepID=UPI0003F8DC16|nr:ATP-binding protein [Leisingera aquimarina]